MAEPFRDTFFNIPMPFQALLYVSAALAVAVFAYGVYRRVALWRAGQPAYRLDNLPLRFKLVLVYALGQVRVVMQRYPGLMHLGMLWGSILLFLGTVLATVDYDITVPLLGFKFLKGNFYLLYELTLDLFGVLFIVGLLMALYRRAVMRPQQLSYDWGFTFTLALLLIINLSGFLLEGFRMALVRPPWGPWSPVGYGLGQLFLSLGLGRSALHLATWLFHAGVSLMLVALVPYTTLFHLVTTPLNIFFSSLEHRGALAPIELEEVEFFGVGKLEEFTWKQRLGFDACTQCGRCQATCPAYMAGTPLSPKDVIVKLGQQAQRSAGHEGAPALHGDVIAADELWACTTCLACMRECPVFIEIVDDIVDLRRYLTLSEGHLPSTAAMTLRHMTVTGNPWGLPPADRTLWAEGLDVRWITPEDEVEYLYWVGCSAAYDRRNQKIARALIRVLQAAGVDFAIMAEEKCSGDSARRLGEEYLFQTLAAENIENLKKYRFQKILTHCPHCFNTLKNEYPQFGGRFEVVHHSQLITQLLAEGRIVLAEGASKRITYHDSCYLGRYNDIYDAPREILARMPDINLVEMDRSREQGLCCGGGGGHMWMEIEGQTRVNLIRLEEALMVNPQVVSTACPFCLSMLDAARKVRGVEDGMDIKDIAELVAEALA
ncbi:MAG: heterodisulfide reductase-related iron-sulfur binding cluster [Anaerolineae bacterium]